MRYPYDGKRVTFKPRHPYLFALAERLYDGFTLSCRHKDILRCSKTKHFRSCFSPDGINRHIPYKLCVRADYAIIGCKDIAGDYIWRAFVRLSVNYKPHALYVHPVYGNPPDRVKDLIFKELGSKGFEVYFEPYDPY